MEFKSVAATIDQRFWVQLIRSVVAMHNSRGGVIVFGLSCSGEPVECCLDAIRAIDPIIVSDKVKHFTDRPLPGVVRHEFEKHCAAFPGWVIPAGLAPLPFCRGGDVPSAQGKPQRLFHPGQLYVRRGASSVPADATDMTAIMEHARKDARRMFAEEIGRFAVVPEGHSIQLLPNSAIVNAVAAPGSVRITTDPNATPAIVLDKFTTHPNRRTELVRKLATRVPTHHVTTHDIQCIRKLFASEIEPKGYVYLPPRSSPHYSDDFVEWIIGKISDDRSFLEKTRAAYKQAAA